MSLSRRSVFVIDDSELSLAVISAALEGAGFDVHAFSSAFLANSQIDVVKPAAIVIDLMMPALGGDKVVDVFRRHAIHKCPVIIYSGVAEPELRTRARACGADGYVRKTQDLSQLVRALHAQVREAW